ncbi:unnamed protein product [Caenorhabditis auriculariae]|uniref:Uncharacterized protein n=1 Tax=Caenorhabditis auriculariae TaxID=2777116 RepID=A0A8S1HDN9_9PELO|nr:unnamed protein product [Caenorhabditis auriculariae]
MSSDQSDPKEIEKRGEENQNETVEEDRGVGEELADEEQNDDAERNEDDVVHSRADYEAPLSLKPMNIIDTLIWLFPVLPENRQDDERVLARFAGAVEQVVYRPENQDLHLVESAPPSSHGSFDISEYLEQMSEFDPDFQVDLEALQFEEDFNGEHPKGSIKTMDPNEPIREEVENQGVENEGVAEVPKHHVESRDETPKIEEELAGNDEAAVAEDAVVRNGVGNEAEAAAVPMILEMPEHEQEATRREYDELRERLAVVNRFFLALAVGPEDDAVLADSDDDIDGFLMDAMVRGRGGPEDGFDDSDEDD